jgi:hypothetical protein
VNGPAVAARGDTVAVAWFTLAGDVARVRFARSTDGGITFGPAVEIAGESPLGRVDLVLLDDGNAVVSWLDQDATGAESLKLRVVSADGKAHAPITLAGTESGRPGGFPQMQSDGRDLILAWTGAGRAVARAGAGAGAESTIRSARLILPAPALSTTHP